jgi:hypothetical protein
MSTSPQSSSAPAQKSDRTVSCALCGTTGVGPPLTWMFEADQRRGGLWYCDRCARDNLRSVEAKLDPEWW